MRRLFLALIAIILPFMPFFSQPAHAASGVFASGGGSYTVGQQFTVTVKASGASFDALQGSISVSGPVTIVGFSAGSATWLPGKTPANGQQFVGITTATDSLVVAKVTLKGKEPGTGSVNVSNVKLASKGSVVGTDAGGANFTVTRAPQPPGTVSVSSSSHPDQNTAYEARTIVLSWNKPAGAEKFSYLLDQSSKTTPPTTGTSADTSVTYDNKDIGTYFFHIRAQNGDGWGPTTHFQIKIKEPDPKINDALAKPVIKSIKKNSTFQTNLNDGTLTGLILTGTAEPNYKVLLSFTPSLGDLAPDLLTATADAEGGWKLNIDVPVKAGFYTVTAQGQLDKTLTQVSEPVKVELSLAKGGNVQFITTKDAVPSPVPTPSPNVTVKGSKAGNASLLWALLFAVIATGALGITIRQRNRRFTADKVAIKKTK